MAAGLGVDDDDDGVEALDRNDVGVRTVVVLPRATVILIRESGTANAAALVPLSIMPDRRRGRGGTAQGRV